MSEQKKTSRYALDIWLNDRSTEHWLEGRTTEQERPPRGIIPYDLWLEDRMLKLSNAIDRAVEAGYYTNVYKWTLELQYIVELRFPDVKNE